MGTRSLRPSPSSITVDRVVVALVLVLAGLFLLASIAVFGASWLYLVYLLVTVFVVRSVAVEPGRWLGLRVVRRGLVAITALIALDFLAISAQNMRFVGAALVLLLALCDLALGRATRRIATADLDHLDERQEFLRNRAHRIAYVIFGVSLGLVVLVTDLASPSTRQWLSDVVGGGGVVTFIQLLFFLPTMVIAWIEPDRIPDEDASRLRRNPRARVAYGMVAVALALPIVFALSLAVAPVRTSTLTDQQPDLVGQNGINAGKCEYFQAVDQVGIGFGAAIPISAVACWNGRIAFEEWGLNDSDCHAAATVLVIESIRECSRYTDGAGSLHFVYRTTVSSSILPFISRDLLMTLVLSKNGKVVQFP